MLFLCIALENQFTQHYSNNLPLHTDVKKEKTDMNEKILGFIAVRLTFFLISINMNFFTCFHQESVKGITVVTLYSTY